MSRAAADIRVGAVAYHPRVVTIWESFLKHFAKHGIDTDYILYSNYERQINALFAGEIDIGWNTNTAFVAVERRLGEPARVLGMRDIDAEYASVLVAPRGSAITDVTQLTGRRLALGSRDSAHAAILPLAYLRDEGLNAEMACELIRFDSDIGTHGDTGTSELEVVRAVAEGIADAGALGEPTLAAFRAERVPALADLEVVWRSPTYSHCNFTALPDFSAVAAEQWRDALLAMDYQDSQQRHAMDLEGVRCWLPGDRSGYESLTRAFEHRAPTL